MVKYVIRRLGFLFLTVILTSIIIFAITEVLPGDVCRVILGREVGEEALAACREDLGLDKPVVYRYAKWLLDFTRGDWGTSYSTRTEIRPQVMGRLRNSLMLAGMTLLIAVPISVILGVIAGFNEGKLIDRAISLSSLAVVGLPEFVTGILLIEIYGHWLGWLPPNSSIRAGTGFVEAFPQLILPALTATFVLLAYVSRLTRAGVIEELKRSYVRTAVLKGLTRRSVMVKHVLRNALLPTITVLAISFGWLISGLIVIENVFNYPGLGRLLTFAIDRRDLPLLQAVTMITVFGFVGANFAADLLYSALNPRIRVGS
jgi:peptide/nickel transport system permease protein